MRLLKVVDLIGHRAYIAHSERAHGALDAWGRKLSKMVQKPVDLLVGFMYYTK